MWRSGPVKEQLKGKTHFALNGKIKNSSAPADAAGWDTGTWDHCHITYILFYSHFHVSKWSTWHIISKASIQMSQVNYYHKGILRTSGLGSGICYIFAASKEEEGGKKLRKTCQKKKKKNPKTMQLKVFKRINQSPVWGTLLYWICLEISWDKQGVLFSRDSSSTFSLGRSRLK